MWFDCSNRKPGGGCARPHAAIAAANGNSYTYDANGNMTVRQEKSNDQLFVYAQTWTVDNRLASVTKRDLTGTVFAETTFFYDGDGVRVRKDDPDGTTLYAGPVEQTIGPGGTATAEYFDDISGTSTLTAFVATRNETVTAGFQQTFTVPPAGLGSEPYGVRYQIWLMVPTTDTYRLAVYADDGFLLSGQGLSLSNATTRDVTTTEASTVLTLTPGAVYNFALTYLNYSAATPAFAGAGCALRLLWRKGGGPLEIVPREAIRARGRRDYYSFGGAMVAMKEGVISTAPRVLTYLHGDHLGSVSLTTNASGQKVSEQRYKPYGEVRWASGAGMPTDKQFTSQIRFSEGYVGTLYDYVARAYDPVLGRFISADTIVLGTANPQAYDRYAYVFGSPHRFIDPSGHVVEGDDGGPNLESLLRWHDEGAYEQCYVQSCHLTAYANWQQANPGSNWATSSQINESQRSDLWLAQMANLAARGDKPTFEQILGWASAAGLAAAEGGDLYPGVAGDTSPDVEAPRVGRRGSEARGFADEAASLRFGATQDGWVSPEAGGRARIGGRWFSEPALERMAPDTPEVRALLEARALTRAKAVGLEPGSAEFKAWWGKNGPDPRGVPPMVVESEIANPGTSGVRVITNQSGDVISVIPRR